jgi:hypothetical protein
MLNTTEIGAAGEKIVNAWLLQNGYNTDLDTRQPGSTNIQAVSQKASLLVQIKSSVAPNVPADLSTDEMRNIKARTLPIGFQAWQVKVTIDSQLRLIGSIQWNHL